MEISNDDYDKGPETPGPDMHSSRAEAAGFDFLEDDRELIQSLVNESTYAGRRLSTNVQVPGELVTFLQIIMLSLLFHHSGSIHRPEFREFWEKSLCPTGLTLDTIRHGYRLPFRELPPRCCERNNRSARDDPDFVFAEVMRLEKLKCISRVDSSNIPHCVLPLSSIVSRKKVSLNSFLLLHF